MKLVAVVALSLLALSVVVSLCWCGAEALGSWTKVTLDRKTLTAIALTRSQHAGDACSDFDSVDKSTLKYAVPNEEPPWNTSDRILVWRSDTVTAMFERILDEPYMIGAKASFRQVFSAFQEEGCQVYPHGGVVRDIILGLEFNDIDIAFSCPAAKIGEIANRKGWITTVEEKFQYVKIGPQECCHVILEGNNQNKSITDSLLEQEFTTNSLSFDVNGNNVIIDSAGTGIQDTCDRLIRITAPCNDTEPCEDWDDWAYRSRKKLLRFWKLRASPKNYTAVDTETFDFIVKHFYNATYWNELKPLTKQFYCRTLIGGNVTEQNDCIACCPVTDETKKMENWINVARADLGTEWFDEHMEGMKHHLCTNDTCVAENGSTQSARVTSPVSTLFIVTLVVWLGFWFSHNPRVL